MVFAPPSVSRIQTINTQAERDRLLEISSKSGQARLFPHQEPCSEEDGDAVSVTNHDDPGQRAAACRREHHRKGGAAV